MSLFSLLIPKKPDLSSVKNSENLTNNFRLFTMSLVLYEIEILRNFLLHSQEEYMALRE